MESTKSELFIEDFLKLVSANSAKTEETVMKISMGGAKNDGLPRKVVIKAKITFEDRSVLKFKIC
jgi:hypothetical protein